MGSVPAFLKKKSLDILLLRLAVKMRQVTFPPPSWEEETEEGRVELPQWGGEEKRHVANALRAVRSGGFWVGHVIPG